MNNNNGNPYLNQQAPGWNNNNNNYAWNQGSARPAWYNNTASELTSSMLVCFILLSIVLMR